MLCHLSSSIRALLKYANEARSSEHRAVKWGVADARRTPVTGRRHFLSRFSIGRRAVLMWRETGCLGRFHLAERRAPCRHMLPRKVGSVDLGEGVGFLNRLNSPQPSPHERQPRAHCTGQQLCKFWDAISRRVPDQVVCHRVSVHHCVYSG